MFSFIGITAYSSDGKTIIVDTQVILNQDLKVRQYMLNSQFYFVGVSQYHNPNFTSGAYDITFTGEYGAQLNYDSIEFVNLEINKTLDASGVQGNWTNKGKNVGGFGTIDVTPGGIHSLRAYI